MAKTDEVLRQCPSHKNGSGTFVTAEDPSLLFAKETVSSLFEFHQGNI